MNIVQLRLHLGHDPSIGCIREYPGHELLLGDIPFLLRQRLASKELTPAPFLQARPSGKHLLDLIYDLLQEAFAQLDALDSIPHLPFQELCRNERLGTFCRAFAVVVLLLLLPDDRMSMTIPAHRTHGQPGQEKGMFAGAGEIAIVRRRDLLAPFPRVPVHRRFVLAHPFLPVPPEQTVVEGIGKELVQGRPGERPAITVQKALVDQASPELILGVPPRGVFGESPLRQGKAIRVRQDKAFFLAHRVDIPQRRPPWPPAFLELLLQGDGHPPGLLVGLVLVDAGEDRVHELPFGGGVDVRLGDGDELDALLGEVAAEEEVFNGVPPHAAGVLDEHGFHPGGRMGRGVFQEPAESRAGRGPTGVTSIADHLRDCKAVGLGISVAEGLLGFKAVMAWGCLFRIGDAEVDDAGFGHGMVGRAPGYRAGSERAKGGDGWYGWSLNDCSACSHWATSTSAKAWAAASRRSSVVWA